MMITLFPRQEIKGIKKQTKLNLLLIDEGANSLSDHRHTVCNRQKKLPIDV